MADPGCLFCRIVSGEIPAQRIAEDEHALAFPDVNPQAPVHVLVIPKKHLASLADVPEGDWDVMGKVNALAARVARDKGLDKTGFRTVVNTGRDAHQVVFHIHLHLLGGRAMGWPPG